MSQNYQQPPTFLPIILWLMTFHQQGPRFSISLPQDLCVNTVSETLHLVCRVCSCVLCEGVSVMGWPCRRGFSGQGEGAGLAVSCKTLIRRSRAAEIRSRWRYSTLFMCLFLCSLSSHLVPSESKQPWEITNSQPLQLELMTEQI